MSIFLGSGPPVTWETIGLVAVLLVVGLLLFGAELFVLPGFGLLGIIGALAMLGGMLAAWFMIGPFWGGVVVAVSSVLVVVFVVAAVRSRAVRKRLVLEVSHGHGGGSETEDMIALVGMNGQLPTGRCFIVVDGQERAAYDGIRKLAFDGNTKVRAIGKRLNHQTFRDEILRVEVLISREPVTSLKELGG